ncbi:MAG: sigma-70 family RNA polymerase sigma factor [Bacteroidota bacterium]
MIPTVAFRFFQQSINELLSAGNVKRMVRYADEDIQLIHRFKEGDAQVFDLLVERYQQGVFNIIHHTMGKIGNADDLAQDIFIKVYHALPSYKERSTFSTWLFRITVNVCIDEIRRKKRHRFLHIEELDDRRLEEIPAAKVEEGVEERIGRNEMKKLVHEAIAGLPELYRTVVTLRDINDLSYDEIAKILRCRIGTVKSRLFYARMKLRENLLKYI